MFRHERTCLGSILLGGVWNGIVLNSLTSSSPSKLNRGITGQPQILHIKEYSISERATL